MSRPLHVLISGAGIAGPTLAWWLAKIGAHVTVVEKSPAFFPHGQNVDVENPALTVLKKMSLLDEVKRAHTTEAGTQFIDSKGRPFAPFPINSAATFTSAFEILRGDLAQILWKASKDHPNTRYLLGTVVKKVLSNDETSVKVELSNGDVNEYDLLVAADGQWSPIRRSNFPDEQVKVVDKGAYAMYHTVPRLPTDNLWWNIYSATRSRLIAYRPDPYGTTRAMYTFMPRTAADKAEWEKAARADRATKEGLMRKTFADAGWETKRFLDAMSEAPDYYFHPLQQIRMDTWSTGRITCLGDAAWAPTPLCGCGTSLAITGAYILAGELGKLQAGQHPSAALEGYEKAFKPFVIQSQSIPSFLPSVVHPQTEWGRTFLQYFVRFAHSIFSTPWIANRISPPRTQEISDDETEFELPPYTVFDGLTHTSKA